MNLLAAPVGRSIHWPLTNSSTPNNIGSSSHITLKHSLRIRSVWQLLTHRCCSIHRSATATAAPPVRPATLCPLVTQPPNRSTAHPLPHPPCPAPTLSPRTSPSRPPKCKNSRHGEGGRQRARRVGTDHFGLCSVLVCPRHSFSAGGMRIPAHSTDRPSEHKPKEDSIAAKLLEKQEQALSQ